MQDYQRAFIDFVIRHEILRFGSFTLKSGRTSPYLFNAGLFNTGEALAFIGNSYAAALAASGVEYDLLFGPAYKGIPLVAATATALAQQHGINKPYCFNRKEAKDHGEGGLTVGAPLQGRVLIVDDVITAGTAIREVMELLQGLGAKAHAAACLVNRSGGNPFAKDGLATFALAEVTVQTWKPEECPLCKSGSTAIKPGSRAKPAGT